MFITFICYIESVDTDMSNSNRHVSFSIKILRSLLDKNLYKNEIIEQTCSDRSFVYEVLNALEKGQLIEEEKILKRERRKRGIHTQAKMMQITDLGRELMQLMVSSEKYNEAFQRFEHSSIENTFDESDYPHQSVLQSKGWIKKEIAKYDSISYSINQMRDFFIKNIFNALISGFTNILKDIGSDNDLAKDILTTIVTNEISHQLSILSIEYSQKESIRSDPMHIVSQDLARPIEEDITKYYHNFVFDVDFLHNHSLINNNLKDTLVSLLRITHLTSSKDEILIKTMLSQAIHGLRHSIREIEKEMPKQKSHVLESEKEILDIYERLLRKFTRFICVRTDEIPMCVKPSDRMPSSNSG
jgi:DNA-binding PadR family transcriptional regulator